MRTLTLTILTTLLLTSFIQAQTGCPGCSVNVPAGLPVDTVYLPELPDGVVGSVYNHDLSFRLPKTTTPVYALDSTTPPGLAITKFEIVAIDGLPAGMYWQPNKFNFDVSTETDGCIKICGTPFQSDSFELTVTLRATIFFLAQEATFPMSLYIAPKVSNTTGFSMTDPEGCGSTTVMLTNMVPSGGNSGFTYSWDFGDGSPLYTGENPPPHTYSEVGMYPVSYHAIVDTAGYTLESIKVLDADCSDALGLGAPDMYLQISSPNNGPIIFDSSPDISNISLPYVFPVGLRLNQGNYILRVWDEDSGIEGSDDLCGQISFNLLSGDTLVSGGITVVLNIVHPVEEIFSVDTVIVYPQPIAPVVSAPAGSETCAGATDLVLVSSYGSGNEWLRDGNLISGATDFIYKPTQTGHYQARIISQYGCVAISNPQFIEFHALPESPVWYNYNNSLRVYDTAALPSTYALQWYLGTNPIPGETGIWYCSMNTGTYGLVVTDLETGCTSSYANLVQHNAAFDCTVSVETADLQILKVYPNPASEVATVRLPGFSGDDAVLRCWDFTGRLVFVQTVDNADEVSIDLAGIPNGVYTFDVQAKQFKGTGKLVVIK
ncbi:MAG: T9SS type A sorting domain-containing protein [Saprospiraceae bacterium]|nr:T9SS type A sorting domain-containing protein [Saprospiraceae bacterium]